MRRNLGDCAVVLGGSIAGLLTARVLADRFAEVVVVERDRLPNAAEPRRGVPQGRHIHGLLAGGQQALEQLLPGLTGELAADGVPVGDPLADVRLSLNGHRFRQAPSGLTLVSASRGMLEHHVRRRVRSLPNVNIADSRDVVGLAGTGGRIRAVRVLRRADNSVEELLDADLVVDATGRGSRAPVWLSDIGYARPEEEQLRVDLGYTTRRYRLPPDTLDGDLGLLRAPTPRHPRGAALARLEDGVWMLTLIGLRADHPPCGVEDFDRFAASVGSDELSSLIRSAEPIDDPVTFRFPASTRRHYERTPLPDNLVVIGDSLASFNPVYGQGMTVAALEAVALARQLSAERVPPSRAMMGDLVRKVDVPWRMAGGVDRAFLPSDKPQARIDRFMTAYVDRVQAAAEHDPVAGRGFLRVSGLIDPPETLLRPSLMWRTLHRRLATRIGSPRSSSPDRIPTGLSRGSGWSR
jgi:2-polyprenyl-6-methoxyphenol hydroxylase-like FAD-dependent oxidoreductase